MTTKAETVNPSAGASAHTALPWRTQEIETHHWQIIDDNVRQVGIVRHWPEKDGLNSPRSLAETAANAEFIVRAVNSHEELLAALRDSEKWMTHSLVELREGNGGMVRATKAARAVIAKAEGRG